MTRKRWIVLIALLLAALGGGLLRSVTAAEERPTVAAQHPRKILGAREVLAVSPAKTARPITVRSRSFATLMTEGFEGVWPAAGWFITDTSSLDDGEYLFGKRDCHPHAGSYGGWSIGEGAQGSLLSCTANYPDYAT